MISEHALDGTYAIIQNILNKMTGIFSCESINSGLDGLSQNSVRNLVRRKKRGYKRPMQLINTSACVGRLRRFNQTMWFLFEATTKLGKLSQNSVLDQEWRNHKIERVMIVMLKKKRVNKQKKWCGNSHNIHSMLMVFALTWILQNLPPKLFLYVSYS